MIISVAVIIACLSPLQDAPSADVAQLIRDLGADDWNVREKAVEELVKRGTSVLPAVREATKSNDPEVAGRAKMVAEGIGIRERVPSSLFGKLPWLEDELRRGRGYESWKRIMGGDKPEGECARIEHEEWVAIVNEALRKADTIGVEQMRLLIRFVVGEFGRDPLKESMGSLAPLLKDRRPEFRKFGVYALGRLGAKEYASQIFEFMKDADPNMEDVVLDAIVDLDAKDLASKLIALLPQGADAAWSNLDWKVFRVIGRLRSKATAPQFAVWMKQRKEIRGPAMGFLVDIGAKEYAKDIAPYLKDPEQTELACYALGLFGSKEHIAEIEQLLDSDVDGVRWTALYALWRLRQHVVPSHKNAYAEESPVTSVCLILGEVGVQKVSGDIVRCLRHTKSADQKIHLIDLLARSQATDAAEGIVEFLKDREMLVRDVTVKALASLKSPAIAPYLEKDLASDNPDARWRAVFLLGELGDRKWIDPIATMLGEDDPSVRKSVICALGKLGATDHADKIAPFLERKVGFEDEGSRWAALYALGELRAKVHAPRIAKFLEEDETIVLKRAAINTLRKMGAREYAPLIEKHLVPISLFSEDWMLISLVAVEALADFASPAARDKIVELQSALQEMDLADNLLGGKFPESDAIKRQRKRLDAAITKAIESLGQDRPK